MAGLALGPFQLEEKLGRGANGEVWRAIHVPSGLPVAVKIMTAPGARRPEVSSQLENEVRAVAALDHPNIVMLLDHGQLEEGTAELPSGSPYLVMELASGGTLDRIKKLTRYEDLRSILLALLDALAHAHARGVIHRDLTPRNILIAKKQDMRPGFKIADFGIALPADTAPDPSREDAVVGTLGYMAPEQLRARWRDYGPWTDLFSLGLIAQRLVTGRAPYPEGKPSEVFEARLLGRRAPLEPLFSLPHSFTVWLDRMLADEPPQRFQRAADAAFALAELGTPEDDDDFDSDESTIRTAIATARTRTLSDLDDRSGDIAHTADRPPPMPKSWRHARPSPPPIRLIGAGRGLFRLRAHPFVGRERERDQIWDHLKTVSAQRRARLLVLAGPAGVGRSRLAGWVSHRAHELGVSTILRATFRDVPGRSDGLGPMLERTLRTDGLPDPEVLPYVRHRLSWFGLADEVLARALARLMRPPIALEDDAPNFAPVADRYELLRRFMARIGEARPLLVWLDDVQFGADALAFIDHVLSNPKDTPVLFIATVSDEALVDRRVEVALLGGLLQNARTTKIELAPLAERSHRELIDQLLPFSPEAKEHLAERTMGNPLLAMELVREWVECGVLVSSPAGFEISPGSSIPTGVHQVWLDQLERILADHPGWWRALEIAAVLGMEVDDAEWAHACDAAGLRLGDDDRDELRRRLLRNSLARLIPRGFSWANAGLRSVLVADGDERKLVALHAAAASATGAAGAPSGAARLAFHLQQAGRGKEAIAPLLAAARSLLEASDLAGARAMLDRRDAILSTESVPSSDLVWGAGWVVRAEVLLHLGQIAEAEAVASMAIDVGTMLGWKNIVPAATFVRARLAATQGELDHARELLDRAARLHLDEGNQPGAAACLRELGHADLMLGNIDTAERKLEEARKSFEALGDALGLALTHGRLGLLERRRRNYDASRDHFTRALGLFRARENRFGMALALNGLGDAMRSAGRNDQAESSYRDAEKTFESIAALSAAATPRLNRALLALVREDFETAFRLAESARPALERASKKPQLACAEALGLPRAAHARAWDEFDRRLEHTDKLISQCRYADPDLAFILRVASVQCLRANEPGRGEHLLGLAEVQLRALAWIE